MSDLLVIRSRFEDRLRRINADLPAGATEVGELYAILYNHRHEIADIVAAAREHWIEGGDSVRLSKQALDALRRLDGP